MRLIAFSKNDDEMCCPNCGEHIEDHKVFIVVTTEKCDGADTSVIDIATLIINGENYATVRIVKKESDAGGDVAYLQLSYIPAHMQTDETAEIIADFAEWARFDWETSDKQSELPTLVRLIGFKQDKRKPFPYDLEMFIALDNALVIKAEHLAWEFTSREIGE
jgi:hypothetical protein